MALHHLSTVLCDYPIISAEGRGSAVGIFHNAIVKEFPAGKDPMGIIVAFSGDPGDPYSMSLEGPGGVDILLGEGTVQAPTALREHEQSVVTHLFTAHPAQFPAAGVYRIVLRSGDQGVHEHPFGVFVGEAESSEEGSADGQ